MHPSISAEMEPVVLQSMLDNLPVGLMVIDDRGEIITINRAASEILGHSLDAFEGKGWGEIFFGEEENSEFNQVIVDIIWEKKVNLKRGVCYSRPDGKPLQLSITGSFLREDDHIVGIVVLISDVTELYQAHQKEKTVLEEKTALEHERAESIRNLAQAVAHQIRNPVTAIGGFSRRILNRLDRDDPNRGYLEMIIHGTQRLENLVAAVADYTKLLEARPKRVSISAILDRARDGLPQREAELSKKIEWSIQAPPMELMVDPALFSRALNEVFLNALEFSKDDRLLIEVRVSEDRGGVTVEVTDSGPGISATDRPYIFDPFFTTKAVGVGMGLCRVRGIVAEHKGDLRVDSLPGKGTRVTIRVPENLHARR